MTLKDLFVLARSGMEVVITECDFEERSNIVYVGRFFDFPYKFADCIVSEFYIRGNKLVIEIFN